MSRSRSYIRAALTDAGIPRDVQFFIGRGGRATACFGDWHSKEICDVANKLGRKLFSNYEEPDDSEIGRPEWAVGDSVTSKATGRQVLEKIPHKCEEVTCQACGKSWTTCSDLVRNTNELEAHKPKKHRTVAQCRGCELEARRSSATPPAVATKLAAVLPAALRKAINVTHTHPTPGQIVAGNYKKGEFRWSGMIIKIENPEGTTRRGVDPNGKAWESRMACTYGYFRGTKGKDGDPVDVFVGPHLTSPRVYVIDQEIDGKFDEHKVVIGVRSPQAARKLYLANYEKGWRCGKITGLRVDEFRRWLKTSGTTRPIADQMKSASAADERIEEVIGDGWLARASDYIPLMPTGARRAGAAALMAARMGEEPGVLLRNPILSQLAATAAGAGIGATLGVSPALSLLPLLAVQAVKAHQIGDIKQRYIGANTDSMRALQSLRHDDVREKAMGSGALGAELIYNAMRKRPHPGLSAAAEMGDAAQLMIPGALPIVQAIDHMEARGLRKSAAWDDEANIPTLPLMMLAGLAGSAASAATPAMLAAAFSGLTPTDKATAKGAMDAAAGDSIPMITGLPVRNAYYSNVTKADNQYGIHVPDDVLRSALMAEYDRQNSTGRGGIARLMDRLDYEKNELPKQIALARRNGMAEFNDSMVAPVIAAHEGGHAWQENRTGLLRALQRARGGSYEQLRPLTAPIAAVSSMGAGLATGSPVAGGLIGLIAGGALAAPTLATEGAASIKGLQTLASYEGGKHLTPSNVLALLGAFGSYALPHVVVPAAAGVAGGWLARRRAKRRSQAYADLADGVVA